MKRVIIANPNAGSGAVRREWAGIKREIFGAIGTAEDRFTACAGDAARLVKDAAREGFEQIIVVGGDGTLNEAVNGWFDAEGAAWNPDAALVVYPRGTGGDFSRSIGLTAENPALSFADATTRAIDVGSVRLTDHHGQPQQRYFLNISSFGSSGVISDSVNRMGAASKFLGGKATYAFGTVRGLLSYRNQRVRLRVDDAFEAELVINTVAVANGRYFGGSMKVAPQARLDDGLFDVVIMGDISLVDFIKYNPELYRGEHLELPGFSLHRGRKVVATPVGNRRDVLVETDGETPGKLPVTYEVMPGALRVYAPWGRAEAVA
ncbi:MAG: diacylglycerol kinase family protein [Myxococcota bacterium]|nr:diacylglycerol kinase family protein [Myxococcota bacterium]